MGRKVSINMRPVSSHYVGRDERVIEFAAPNGRGGLINFVYDADTGIVQVTVHRLSPGVEVTVSPA